MAQALNAVFGLAAEAVGQILKDIGYALDAVGDALQAVFDLGSDALEGILEGIGFAVDAVEDFLDSLPCPINPLNCF